MYVDARESSGSTVVYYAVEAAQLDSNRWIDLVL